MTTEEFIKNAMIEDIGNGDHTSLSCIPENAIGKSKLLVKQKGIIAGVEIAREVFRNFDPDIKMNVLINDGTEVDKGDIVFTVEGKSRILLQAERLVLNFMQRMSGIATETNEYVKLLKGLKTKVLDTRKTTPNCRFYEKQAVKIGGGENHRMGLYDMILIKDNHIDFAGGIVNAITRVNQYLKEKKLNLKIEIEARNLDEVKSILNAGNIDRIMLDNFNYDDLRTAVKLINGKYETEASGNINKTTVRQYAECGVDFVSVGSLTHQIHSLDLSLKAIV